MDNRAKIVLVTIAVVALLGVAWFCIIRNKIGSSETPPPPLQNDIIEAYKANCVDVKIPRGQELDISADPETGLVTIGYTDENALPQEVVLYYHADDGFAGCSEDARRVLLQIKESEKP